MTVWCLSDKITNTHSLVMRDLLKLKTLCHKDLLSFKQRVIVFSIFLIRKRKYFAENAKTS